MFCTAGIPTLEHAAVVESESWWRERKATKEVHGADFPRVCSERSTQNLPFSFSVFFKPLQDVKTC